MVDDESSNSTSSFISTDKDTTPTVEEEYIVNRVDPQCSSNWVKKSRFDNGKHLFFYVNTATGEERKYKPNFFFHGKSYKFVNKSLGLLPVDNWFRQRLAWFVTWRPFDDFILWVIIANSILLMFPSLQVTQQIDMELDSPNSWTYHVYPHTLEADPSKSWRNELLANSEMFFTVTFTIEFIAMGFFFAPGAYLKDYWNWIDFIVVVAGILQELPGFPSVSVLRTIRVLRPLRSLARAPALKQLINTLLSSIPALMSVLSLLAFVFTIFGILAIQLWGGLQDYRCRRTAFPLERRAAPLLYDVSLNTNGTPKTGFAGTINLYKASPKTFLCPLATTATCVDNATSQAYANSQLAELSSFECSDMEDCVWSEHYSLLGGDGNAATYYTNFMETKAGTDEWKYCGQTTSLPNGFDKVSPGSEDAKSKGDKIKNKSDSPWATEKDCFWPINDDGRVCSAEKTGWNECPVPSLASLKCTEDPNKEDCNWCQSNYDLFGNPRFKNEKVQIEGSRGSEDLAFGYTRFNWIFSSFMTIFQCITEEGWTDVMYQIMDGYSYTFGAIYFMLLILVGSFFCLNLTLAVIWNEFVKSEDKAKQIKARAELVRRKYGGGAMEDAREAKEKAELEAPSKPDMRRSYFCCGPTGANIPVGETGGRHKNCPNVIVRKLYAFVEHPLFEAFIVFCILANTVTLAMDKYPEDVDEAETLEVINFILTFIFILEMIFKLIGLGLVEYIASRFNQFDAFIVFMSIVELILSPPSFMKEQDGTGGGALSVLRTFRLFRLFKLARSWKSLQHLLRTMVKTLGDISNFAVLLVLFMYIFALVGMQFFANRYRFDDRGYALNIILDGDPMKLNPRLEASDGPYNLAAQLEGAPTDTVGTWNYVKGGTPVANLCKLSSTSYKDGDETGGAFCLNPEYFKASVPRAHFDDLLWAFTTVFQVLSGENWNTVMYDGWRAVGWPAVVYFICLMVMGVMIVLELFVAILLGNFEADNEDQDGEEEEEEEEEEEDGGIFGKVMRIMRIIRPEKSDVRVAPMTPKLNGMDQAELDGDGETKKAPRQRRQTKQERRTTKQQWDLAIKANPLLVLNGKSLFCLDTDNKFRIYCARFTLHPNFDRVILVLIGVSSILLGVENPLWDPDGTAMTLISSLDLFMTIAFNIEMVMKVITLGFVMHKRAYLRDAWNVLDFVIVIISNLTYIAKDVPGLKSLKSFRTLRVLRPLRLINRAPGLKLVVNALLQSMPKVAEVLVVCLLFFLIFGIVGINFLKGSLSMCDGSLHNTELDFLHTPVWGDIPKLLPKGASWAKEDDLANLSQSLRYKQGFGWNSPYDAPNAASSGYCDTAPTSSNGDSWCSKCSIEAQCPGKTYFCYLAMVGKEAETGSKCSCKKSGNTISYAADSECSFDATKAMTTMKTDYTRSIFVFEKSDGAGVSYPITASVGTGEYLRGFTTSKGACGFLATQRKERGHSEDLEWTQITPQTFNNLREAMSTLFEMSTTEGWVDIMWAACDSTGIDMQPKFNNTEGWVWFFIFFIVVGSFFVVNLFVGVVCDTFNEMREELGGSFMLTEAQKEWVSMRKKINKLGPYMKTMLLQHEPEGKYRRFCYFIVIQSRFEVFIMSCIIVNTVILSCKSFGESTETAFVFEIMNYIFAFIFTVEAVMKLMGLGTRYFMDSWNNFDFIVVVFTNVGIILKVVLGINIATLATIVRTFRVCRVVRLVQSLKDLRMLINTLLLSLPSLGNIGLLLFLMFFIFSIIGVQQFAKIALYDAINEHSNFQSFSLAFITLYRASTGENWNGQMYALAHQAEGCVDDPPYNKLYCGFEGSDPATCLPLNGCGSVAAYPFWILFTCFVSFVVLNVFVAVILEAFDDSANAEEAKLTDEQWNVFCSRWCEFVGINGKIKTVSDAFKIDMNDLLPFFKSLHEPMGFLRNDGNIIANDKVLTQEIQSMDITTVAIQGSQGLWAEFSNVAVAVAKRVMVAGVSVEDADLLNNQFNEADTIQRKSSGKPLDLQLSNEDTTTQLNAKQYFAALMIACAFRSQKFRQVIDERVAAQKNG